jgi:hypothetical protein
MVVAPMAEDDGLPPGCWTAVSGLVSAASRADCGAYLAACRQTTRELSLVQARTVGVYLLSPKT